MPSATKLISTLIRMRVRAYTHTRTHTHAQMLTHAYTRFPSHLLTIALALSSSPPLSLSQLSAIDTMVVAAGKRTGEVMNPARADSLEIEITTMVHTHLLLSTPEHSRTPLAHTHTYTHTYKSHKYVCARVRTHTRDTHAGELPRAAHSSRKLRGSISYWPSLQLPEARY